MSVLGHRLRMAAGGAGAPSIVSRLTNNQFFTYTAPTGTDYDHTWKSDGTKLFVIVDAATNFIAEYAASTAWDVSTLSYTDKFDVTTIASPRGLTTSSDGTEFYVTGTGDDNADQFTATAWDVSTASYTATELMNTDAPSYDGGCQLVDSGTKFIIADTNQLYGYSLSTADDITTSSYDGTLLPSGYTLGRGFCFTSDGMKVIANALEFGSFNRFIEYDLTTAFDITTATFLDVAFIELGGTHVGVSMKSDDTKLYLSSTTGIREYDVA